MPVLAGPAYKKFEDCVASCPNEILAGYACFARCLFDYGDDKRPSPGMIVDSGSTGYQQQVAFLNGPALNLANFNQATIFVQLLNNCGFTVCPKPLFVEYLSVTWPTSANSFGTLIGTSANDSAGYPLTYNPRQLSHSFGMIVARAHYSSDPLEDIDDISAVFFVNASMAAAPTLSGGLLTLLTIGVAVTGFMLLRR
jgi:hypothetical protein